MRKILFVVILIVLFPLIANAQDISNLVNEYQRCKKAGDCKAQEIRLINFLLKSTDVLTVMDEMPTAEDIEYEILRSNLTGSKNDVIVKIFIPNNLGYVFVLKKDLHKEKYMKLPVIETGFLKISTMDITGDGLSELIIRGRSHETGGYTEWIALYKYKDMKMNLIWSGTKESHHVDPDLSWEEKYDITFRSKGSGPKLIYQIGSAKKTNNATEKIIYEKKTDKKFKWSQRLFKYVEE